MYAKIGDGWVNFSKKGIEISAKAVKKNYKNAVSKEALYLSSNDGKERLLGAIYIKGCLSDLKVLLTGKDARQFAKTEVSEQKHFFNKAFDGEMIFNETDAKKAENIDLIF